MPRPLTQPALPGLLGALAILVFAGAKVTRTVEDTRIAELTARIEALEHDRATPAPAAGMKVEAPFVVTDAGGMPILTVQANPRGIKIQDPVGKVVLAATALQGGGFVKATTGDESRVAVLGAITGMALLNLRDGNTNNRMALSVGSDGTPNVTLFNSTQKAVVELSHRENGGGKLNLSGADGTILVGASALPNGGVIKAVTADGSRAAVLAADAERVFVSLRDSPTDDRLTMAVTKDGSPEFSMLNATHTKMISMGEETGGGGRLALGDPAGKPLLIASALPTGGYLRAQTADQNRVALIGTLNSSAFVSLRDGATTPRATLAVTEDGMSSLVLFNSSHTNVFTLTQGARADGMFQISNAAGIPMVEGGVTPNGFGIVRTGPRYNCGGKMGLVASDCIVGRP